MKKIIQIAIVLILVVALIVGPFQIEVGRESLVVKDSCRVGWNTRTGNCSALGSSLLAHKRQPQVGWNS